MKQKRSAIVAVVALGAVYLFNASWLAPPAKGTPVMLAHRGIHQAYDRTDLTNDTCTASRMLPPTNPYLENTLPSMRASFAAGADALELDVHPTVDGEFAVFHDWTVDCRTNGAGAARELDMAYLRTLDVGHGYTADGGRTFPFRGRGVGAMPTLAEVFAAFPGRGFLINIKSRDPREAERLVAYLKARGLPTDRRLMAYGHETPVDRLRTIAPQARLWSKQGVKACGIQYVALGWTGYVPAACRGATIVVPVNLRWAMWGWPNRFLARMEAAGTDVLIAGPFGRNETSSGLTTAKQLDAIPLGFGGTIWTDAIEVVGPAWRARSRQ